MLKIWYGNAACVGAVLRLGCRLAGMGWHLGPEVCHGVDGDGRTHVNRHCKARHHVPGKVSAQMDAPWHWRCRFRRLQRVVMCGLSWKTRDNFRSLREEYSTTALQSLVHQRFRSPQAICRGSGGQGRMKGVRGPGEQACLRFEHHRPPITSKSQPPSPGSSPQQGAAMLA